MTDDHDPSADPLDALGDPLVAAAAMLALNAVDPPESDRSTHSPPLAAPEHPRRTIHPLLGWLLLLAAAAAALGLFATA